ncbi:MAG: hypothetical protein M1839_004559 [Geoglossum umbratile]|nr:MAG: hypothetical protein M1839_004559 [Geoglossum umbratile]
MRLQGVAVKGRNGALWEVLPMYQYILDHLYKFDAKYTTDEPTYYRPLCASIQLGIQKCDDYFTATDVTLAYLAAIILHPQMKWAFVEKHIWKGHND